MLNSSFNFDDIGHFASRPDGEIARHRWYQYKEGFSPIMVERAIELANVCKDDIIVDPFNGSGTVTLAASKIGISAIGCEVNPFAAFLAKAKLNSLKKSDFLTGKNSVLLAAKKGGVSPLAKFSTFSELGGKSKWLFNARVLRSFAGGYNVVDNMKNSEVFKLSLIGAALDNCNAVKDGKCLKYRNGWENFDFNKNTFLDSLEHRLAVIEEDLFDSDAKILKPSKIYLGDSRAILSKKLDKKFKLCVTSPPYLNSFDYTDVYRPELFLGGFVSNNDELRNLRQKTLRSHVEMKLRKPLRDDFGNIYSNTISKIIEKKELLWDAQIPTMIQGYFEDMQSIITQLRLKAEEKAQLWIVVSNSAYVDIEIPVDLILGEIGARCGWHLKEISVLRNISKRKTQHSSSISHLRESVIIFDASIRR